MPAPADGDRVATRRPRIIFIAMIFDPEPGAMRGLPLAKWLSARGYEIKVITTFPNYPIGRVYDGYRQRLWQWEVMDGIRVLRVPIYPSHDRSALRRILTYLSFAFAAATIGVALIGDADAVYLYDPPPTNGIAAWLLSRLRRIPVVHHIGDMWPESVTESGMVREGAVKRFFERTLLAYCKGLYRHDAVITVLSPGFKRILVDRGVPKEKVHVVYNWVHEETFRPSSRDDALATELGFTGRFTFLYAGNFGPFQGLDTVIRAAALVRDDPRIQIVLIGTGPTEIQLRTLVKELNATNVRFMPYRDVGEMPKINAIADALIVHLTGHDFMAATIPSKTQVALASGRPILAGLRGDAADLVTRGQAGVVCEPEQPEAMAGAMRRLANMTPAQLAEMGRRGREFYLTQLSLDVAGARMDEIFRRVTDDADHKRAGLQLTSAES
jgi:colanic acid biosynthesis glycosyl transferase WcaI